MKDPVVSQNNLSNKQPTENRNFSQYQQIPNFSDKKSLNNNQYFAISTVNNQLVFKIAKSIEIEISSFSLFSNPIEFFDFKSLQATISSSF